MAPRPFLDEWARALLWTAFGAGLVLLFALLRWDLLLLALGWAVAWVGWFVGRFTKAGQDPPEKPRR